MLRLDEDELTAWGRRIGRQIGAPAVLALRGDLGAGKSTLARAIARGMGVEGPVPSPTFNLMFRYETPRGIDLVHIDLYRLEREDEVWALGWSELPAENEVVVVEWPERAEALLPTPRWDVRLREADDGDVREVTVTALGDAGELPGVE